VTAAEDLADELVAEDNAPAGQSFTLTASATTGELDVIEGGAGGDTITAIVRATASGTSTFETGDEINGGAGTDTLTITIADDADLDDEVVDVVGVEIVRIRSLDDAGADDVQADLWDGVTRIESYRSTADVEVADVQNNVTLAAVDTTEDLRVNFADDAIGSDEGALSVALDGADAVTLTASVGGDDSLTQLSVVASGDDSVVDFVLVDAGGAVHLDSITVAGDAALELSFGATEEDDITSFDASKNSGGVTFNASDAAATIEVINGSSGDDAITVNGTAEDAEIDLGDGDDVLTAGAGDLDDAAAVDGGAGDDTISLISMAAANATVFSGFEVADLAGVSGSYDMSLFTNNTFTSVALSAALGGNATLTNLAGTGIVYDVQADAGANTTLRLKTSSGSSDSLTINFDAASNGYDIDDISTDGVETITIDSLGASGTNKIDNLVVRTDTLTKVVITGDHTFQLVDIDLNTSATATAATTTVTKLTLIDGSAATGDITLGASGNGIGETEGVASNVTTSYKGLTVKTGSGDDTIYAEAANTIVYANSGADTVVAESTGATIYVGDGDGDVDAVTLAAAAVYGTSSNLTTIYQLEADDTISVAALLTTAGSVDSISDVNADIAAATSLADAYDLAVASFGIAADGAVGFFNWEADGNTYIVVAKITANDTAINTSDDAVVKLIGTYEDFTCLNGVITIG